MHVAVEHVSFSLKFFNPWTEWSFDTYINSTVVKAFWEI